MKLRELILTSVGAVVVVFGSMIYAINQNGAGISSSLVIVNETSKDTTVFISFGSDSKVNSLNFSFCGHDNKLNCKFILPAKSNKDLSLSSEYFNATISFDSPVGCNTTKAEFNLNNPKWYDVADISLVDGYSSNLMIEVSVAGKLTTIGPINSASGNEKAFGVYPLGCDVCVARDNPQCGFKPGNDGCKSGTQYKPDVPCQYQGSIMGGGSKIKLKLM